MPQVIIKEIDSTSADELEYGDYVVFVPITGYVKNADPDKNIFSNVKIFDAVTGIDKTKSGYKIAHYALESGLKVLIAPYTADMALTEYEDKGVYDIRFMTMGDALDDSTPANIVAFANTLIGAAATRGNTVAVVDVPKAQTDTSTKVAAWADSLGKIIEITREDGTKENGFAYASFIAPWVKFDDPNTGVAISASVPGSIIYLNCFAHHTATYPDWFAMAGSVRGASTFSNVLPDYLYGEADIAALQKRTFVPESGITYYRAVNPICRIRPYGNLVWGNRTGYPLTANEPGLKASSFLNIRQLCCDIKNTLYRASRKYTFEPNSDTLWANFTSEIKPLLEDMRSNQGIWGYKIIKEKTSQKATLKARIKIIPIEAVEDFDLTVEMTDSTVEVNG